MTIPISVIVLTLNEAAGIANTLSHLTDFAEVIICDSNSTDRTVEIAERLGARVVSFTWDRRYPKKKQWALEHSGAKHRWVLLLDADEYPSAELVDELRLLMQSQPPADVGAYDIRLSYRFAGRFLKHGHRVVKRSFIDPSKASFPEMNDLDAPGIREVEGHYQPTSTLTIGTLQSDLVHDDRDPVNSWFDRHNKYSDWEAHLREDPLTRQEIISKRTRNGRIFDRIPFKPVTFFVYGYVARRGFLDGRAGFDYHIAQSMYYWQIGVKARELQARRRAEG